MDLITHVQSLIAMRDEAIAIQSDEDSALAKYFTIDEDGQGVTFNVAKVPVIYANDGQTLCLVRGISQSVIEQSSSINVLATVDGMQINFVDDDARATYESIYNTKPVMMDDGDGGQIEMTPPYLFGCFC